MSERGRGACPVGDQLAAAIAVAVVVAAVAADAVVVAVDHHGRSEVAVAVSLHRMNRTGLEKGQDKLFETIGRCCFGCFDENRWLKNF